MNTTTTALPSLKSLLISTFIAIIIAIFVLIVFVLPAEYDIDLTGLGKEMGLTALSGKDKPSYPIQAMAIPLPTQQLAKMGCSTEHEQQKPEWQDTVVIIVPPHKGLEYKFHLTKDAVLEYAWATDGAKLYFDFHGEPKGDKTGYFKSYKESTNSQSSGDLTAPFEGSHGWYWENKTGKPATIVLNTKGKYLVIGLL